MMKMKMRTQFFVGKPEGKRPSEYAGADGKVTLK
jgi:hypothetical protein